MTQEGGVTTQKRWAKFNFQPHLSDCSKNIIVDYLLFVIYNSYLIVCLHYFYWIKCRKRHSTSKSKNNVLWKITEGKVLTLPGFLISFIKL